MMDIPLSPVVGTPGPDDPCPIRMVLGGVECRCPRLGPHLVHQYRYRTPGGKRYEWQFVEPLSEDDP